MRVFILAAVALFTLPCTLHATDLALTHATVYTQPGRPPLHDATILVHDTRITSVGPANSTRVPADTKLIDCTGLTVTAGFWNSHVHFMPAEFLDAQHQSVVDVLNSQLQTMFTHWGFTTVFDIASILSNTNYIRSQIEGGKVVGPRVLTVGEPFWVKTPIYAQQYPRNLPHDHARGPLDP